MAWQSPYADRAFKAPLSGSVYQRSDPNLAAPLVAAHLSVNVPLTPMDGLVRYSN